MKTQSRFGILCQLHAFLAFYIGIKDQAIRLDLLEQNQSDIGHAVGINRGQGHGIRQAGFGLLGLAIPLIEQGKRRFLLFNM